jgi:hypothetical protein
MAVPKPEKPTVLERGPRPGFPIVRVLGMVNGLVCALCLAAGYIVRQWRLVRQAELVAAERVALQTRGKARPLLGRREG